MTLYEMNQLGYANLSTMNKQEVRASAIKVADFLKSHDSKYYMMLNAEGRYYTLYVYKDVCHSPEKMAAEMIDVAQSLGNLKAIEIHDDMVEFWIENLSVCSMYAVFNYDQGVIEVE